MPSAPPVPIDDYEAIQAAVMETARGRWFLSEYARRNRNADTERVLEAIERVARIAGSPAERNLEISDLAKFVQDARRAMVAVHQATGSAPVDFIVDTMLTLEERLEAVCGRTRAAAKLVAIAEVKPVRTMAEMAAEPAEAVAAEPETTATREPQSQAAGMEFDACEMAETSALEDAIVAQPPRADEEDTIAGETGTEENATPAADESAPLHQPMQTHDEPQAEAALPVPAPAAPSLAVLEEAVAALALQVDDSRLAMMRCDEDDDEELFTEPWSALPGGEMPVREEMPVRRRPLPASLRPDLPLVTAAELDALSFEEKITLFA